MNEDDPEISNSLLAIHSRLGTIEGKVNLLARAEREQILVVLDGLVRRDPLVGQIYLLVDSKRNQREILDELTKCGIRVSQATVSRRMDEMVREHGIAEDIGSGATTVLRKNRAMEDVLNLTRRIRTWLEAGDHPIPSVRPRRSKRKRK